MHKMNFIRYCGAIFTMALAITLNGCSSEDTTKEFRDFPVSATLEGEIVMMPDSIIRIIGKAYVTDAGYIYSIYDAPYALSASDKDFKTFVDFAKKGPGPGEVNGPSLLSLNIQPNDSCIVFNPSSMSLYETSSKSDFVLTKNSDFPDEYKKFCPSRVVRLSTGVYVAARGDFKYGLVAYNPETSLVIEYPLGGSFDITDPVYDEVSMRVVRYNQKNGIVGEIYGCNPTLIMHDEEGKIVGKYKYTGYTAHKAPDNQLADCFMDFELTDNYIWLLYGDQDESVMSKVLVLDYAGEPVAELIIESTQSITVDEQNRKILSVDPNKEDDNLMIYKFPDFL